MTFRTDAPFYAPLKTSLVLQNGSGNPAFTRATQATTFNTENNLVNMPSGAVRFAGARPVINWFTDSSKMDTSASWVVSNMSKASAIGPDGITSDACLVTCTANTSNSIRQTYNSTLLSGNVRTYKFLYKPGTAAWIRLLFYDGTTNRVTIWFNATTNSIGTVSTGGAGWSISSYSLTASTAYSGWYEIYAVVTSPNTGTHYMQMGFVDADNSINTTVINGLYLTLAHPQLENSTGRTDKTPSEYIATGLSTPYYGAGADGVKYFATNKDGSAIADSALQGVIIEPAAITNSLLYSRDLTNAAWAATNITPAKTQTGIDNQANACSLITATANNATIIQTITTASVAASSGFYVKRSVGAGSVYITRDGGTNWTDITSSINASTFSLVKIENTSVLNPQVGFKIATSGDAVIVDGGMNHTGAQLSKHPIFTTSATATRNADVLTYQTSGNFNDTAGAMMATVLRDDWSANNGSTVGKSGFGLVTSSANSGVQALDGTNTISGPAGTPSNSMVIGCRWSGTSLQAYSNQNFGTEGSYDGSFNLSTIAIMPAAAGIIKDVAIWQTSLSDADMIQAYIVPYLVYMLEATASSDGTSGVGTMSASEIDVAVAADSGQSVSVLFGQGQDVLTVTDGQFCFAVFPVSEQESASPDEGSIGYRFRYVLASELSSALDDIVSRSDLSGIIAETGIAEFMSSGLGFVLANSSEQGLLLSSEAGISASFAEGVVFANLAEMQSANQSAVCAEVDSAAAIIDTTSKDVANGNVIEILLLKDRPGWFFSPRTGAKVRIQKWILKA